MRARLRAVRAVGGEVQIPVVVLAETTRGNGPRDAPVNLVLAHLPAPVPLDEATARLAGQMLARARSNATVDALVAAEAVGSKPSVVLTSDPDDLGQLLEGWPGVLVQRV